MILDNEAKSSEANRFKEVSPGKILLWGRERAGLSQEQVASELYMTLMRVRALENDDYRHISSQTFARGYLRAYATLLKLDVVQVLAAYERQLQKMGVADEHLPPSQESGGRNSWKLVFLVLGTLVVLWLISIWFFDNRKQQEYTIPPAVIAQLDTAQESAAAGKTTLLSASASSVSSSASDSFSSSLAAEYSTLAQTQIAEPVEALENNPAAQVQEPVDTTAGVARGLDVLQLSFRQECWLEVSDARGDVLATDLQAAGSQLSLKGVAPFKVKLGNAPGADISINNQPVTLAPVGASGVVEMSIDD